MGISTETFPNFVVNTNTNIIFKYCKDVLVTLPEKKSLDLMTGEEHIFSPRSTKKRLYVKMRSNGELDYKSMFSESIFLKNDTKGYFIHCNNLNKAKYHQALLRMEKSSGESSTNNWREIAENFQNNFPEDLL